MVMRIKVQYICMAFLYVGGFPLYAQKVTDDTISGKTHYIDEVTVKASVATRKVTAQFENLGELVKIPIFGG